MSEAKPDTGEMVPVDATETRALSSIGLYDPDLDFRKLALEATHFAKGFRLVKKEQLLAVPHVILGITYREGFPRAGSPGDYVSLECVVADKDTLHSGPVMASLPVPPDQLTVYPNETVVYNDSSTGVRRQITELLATMGMINPGKANGDENKFDKPFQRWTAGDSIATDGIITDQNGEPFRYVAIRGLRKSDYEWEGQPATTWYIG